MDFPKMINKKIKGIEDVVTIKPYLEIEDINTIISTVQGASKDYATRKMLMYAMVMALNTNITDFENAIEINKLKNAQIVNVQVNIDMPLTSKYYYNGIFDQIVPYIKGFDILSKGIENLTVSDIYKNFENALEGFTNQFKNINVDDSVKQLEHELVRLKEVEKEKDVILNG